MMQREDQAQAHGVDQDDPDWMDWDDDEPEIVTGYEVIDMADHPAPVDSDNSLENQQPTGDNGSSLKGDSNEPLPENRPMEQPPSNPVA